MNKVNDNYRTEVISLKNLGNELREKMVSLYLNYYESSSYSLFFSDLDKKNEVLLLFYESELVGFTTLEVYEYEWEGSILNIVYSGDTIVDKAHWGQQALAFAWILRMGQFKKAKTHLPLYWFLLVKGHRTFKYLPTFGKSFYPHWSIDRSDLKSLADALAKEKFGEDYNSSSGIVEFKESLGHLRQDVAFATEEEKTKESVRFFLKKNPNYLQGHELVCLCEIFEENMKPLTRRIFSKA